MCIKRDLIGTFLKGEPLTSIVARHHRLDASQVFAITRSEILHQLGSKPGEEAQTSLDDGGLILDPPLVRQISLRDTHLLFLEVLDAFFAIQSFQSLIRILAEGMPQLTNFDPAHLLFSSTTANSSSNSFAARRS
jgi:hypothetical protein